MNSIKKVLYIIGKDKIYGVYFLSFLSILNFFLELLSIISIPIFISALLGEYLLLEKYNINFINKENFIIYSSIFVAASFITKNIFLIYGSYFQAKFMEKIKAKISKKLFSHYFKINPLKHYILKPSIMARNSTVEVQGFYVYFMNLNKLFIEITSTLTIFFILLFLNPLISLSVILIFMLSSFLYVKFLRPTLKIRAKENHSIIANFNKIIFETFESIKDIKIYQKEKEVTKIFEKKVDLFEKNIFFFNVLDKFPKIFLELLSIISILLVSVIMFVSYDNFLTNLPLLALIVVSFIRLIPAFTGINSAIFYLRIQSPSLNIIYDQLKLINSVEFENKKNQKKDELKRKYKDNIDIQKNYLVIDDISFSYQNDKKLLEKINIVIPKRSFVSILGPTGSGKTTLHQIMMGQIKPLKGNIFYKNQNIQLCYESWLNNISYVSQKIFLLDETIEKNICLNFGNEEIDKYKLSKAIEVAELEDKIKSLKNGIKEQIGTDGITLSGGERQRIALARAIYKSADILFLDEFTSSLDILTEEKIVNNLKANFPDITIIMVTHRPELTKKSDQIYNLVK